MSNEWFERGELPTIGTNVMVNIHMQGATEATVIGAFERWVWLDVKNKGIDTFDVSYVSPIRTERDKAIEAAVKVISGEFDGVLAHVFNAPKDAAEKLYDAGLLRLPEDKK